jgi:FdhD protein
MITRIRNGARTSEEDLIAFEKPLRLLINGKDFVRLSCSPVMLRELVAGFLLTEGPPGKGFCTERMSIEYGDEIIVDVPAEGDIQVSGAPARTSGCIGGVSFESYENDFPIKSGLKISFDALKALFTAFQQGSNLYRLTGCVHSAALADTEHIIIQAEDVGRHNAVDKVIGYAAPEGIPFNDKVILTTGRLSSEIASKCARAGVPILASRTAPTMRAIDSARKAGITLVGFQRGRSCNIYTHPERIT